MTRIQHATSPDQQIWVPGMGYRPANAPRVRQHAHQLHKIHQPTRHDRNLRCCRSCGKEWPCPEGRWAEKFIGRHRRNRSLSETAFTVVLTTAAPVLVVVLVIWYVTGGAR